MLMPKKFKLKKKKVTDKKDTPSHHSYKVVRCIRARFVPSPPPSHPWTNSVTQLKPTQEAWLFSYQSSKEWKLELKSYLNLSLRDNLCA